MPEFTSWSLKSSREEHVTIILSGQEVVVHERSL